MKSASILGKIFITILILGLTGILSFSAFNVVRSSNKRSLIKKDYSEINNIKHGLLSVTAWRDHVVKIVDAQIDEFDFSNKQEEAIRSQLNDLLNAVISQAEGSLDEKDIPLKERIKNKAIDKFVNFDKIRASIPEYSQTILDELNKNKSKRRLKFIARDKFMELADKTKDSVNIHKRVDDLLSQYGYSSIDAFNEGTLGEIDSLEEDAYFYTYISLAILLLYLLLWVFFYKFKAYHKFIFIASIVAAGIALVGGLLAPMIEIDARIKELNFILIGESLVFYNQVIFFQSKSIVEVVQILISTKKIDSIVVGLLILTFSVVFPITKLVCTEVYFLGKRKLRDNKVINFFVFKSGKWSMVDVLVVAIFMAYIGFDGIFESQLQNLNIERGYLSSIATNKTSLQPGVLLFVGYILFGLALAAILKKIKGVKLDGVNRQID